MREELNNILKHEFRELAICRREELGFTQREMAEALVMSERSYADIERGVSACGVLTVALLLIGLTDSNEFLMQLKNKFEVQFIMGGVM